MEKYIFVTKNSFDMKFCQTFIRKKYLLGNKN